MEIKEAYYQIKRMLDLVPYQRNMKDIEFGARVAYIVALDIIKNNCPEVLEESESE